jgi:hypothetical protein
MNPPRFETASRLNRSAASSGAEVVELELLLPAERAAALEQAARARGLTVGQLTRRLIYEFLDRAGGSEMELA